MQEAANRQGTTHCACRVSWRFWKKRDQKGHGREPHSNLIWGNTRIREIITPIFQHWHQFELHVPARTAGGCSAVCLTSWMRREIDWAATMLKCMLLRSWLWGICDLISFPKRGSVGKNLACSFCWKHQHVPSGNWLWNFNPNHNEYSSSAPYRSGD